MDKLHHFWTCMQSYISQFDEKLCSEGLDFARAWPWNSQFYGCNIEDTRNKWNEHEEDNEGKNDTNYLMLDCNKIHVCQKII